MCWHQAEMKLAQPGSLGHHKGIFHPQRTLAHHLALLLHPTKLWRQASRVQIMGYGMWKDRVVSILDLRRLALRAGSVAQQVALVWLSRGASCLFLKD